MNAAKQAMWDERWMSLALFFAQWSKDQSRKVGAVIVDDEMGLVAQGWNGFPRGVNDTFPERHERPEKYEWTKHAEENAFLNAARNGIRTKGCTLYVPWFPCANCAGDIVQAGIKTVVAYKPDMTDPHWGANMNRATTILMEGGVKIRIIPGSPPVSLSQALPKGRYNGAFTLAFELEFNDPTGEDVTPAMLSAAVRKRADNLDRSTYPGDPEIGGEWLEAVGAPFDVYENDDGDRS